MYKNSDKTDKLVIFLCWAAYAAAYIGRLNFNAYIEPIREQLGATKTELGIVSSFFFFSYGFGQLVHGVMSRKYNTRYSVAVALLGSAAVNVAMTLCTDVSVMKYIWFLNGVFQSILWSSVIKTLSERLPDEMLLKAVVVMSTPPALGTFLVYGISALFSASKVNYRWIFVLPSVILVIIGSAWFISIGKVSVNTRNYETANYIPEKKRLKFTPVFAVSSILLVAAAISNGFIKDGVITWTPSILKESYGMQESLSILATVALPLIAIFGAWISTMLHKRLKNTSALDGILYFAEIIVLILVIFTAHSKTLKSPLILLIFFGVSAMLMSAVNNVITSIIPLYMRDKMDSGLLAGVLDTFCYVGSTLSTGLLGFLADNGGWTQVFNCLLVFGILACIVCWISVFIEKKEKPLNQ